MKKKWYVGRKQSAAMVFASATTPTREEYGAIYHSVTGPFRTKRGAMFDAAVGLNNPHVQHVRDAEWLAQLYQGKA